MFLPAPGHVITPQKSLQGSWTQFAFLPLNYKKLEVVKQKYLDHIHMCLLQRLETIWFFDFSIIWKIFKYLLWLSNSDFGWMLIPNQDFLSVSLWLITAALYFKYRNIMFVESIN